MCHSQDGLLQLEVSWISLVSLQKFFHMTQVSSQHTSLGLQQGYHLHLLYIHNQDDN